MDKKQRNRRLIIKILSYHLIFSKLLYIIEKKKKIYIYVPHLQHVRLQICDCGDVIFKILPYHMDRFFFINVISSVIH